MKKTTTKKTKSTLNTTTYVTINDRVYYVTTACKEELDELENRKINHDNSENRRVLALKLASIENQTEHRGLITGNYSF